MPSNQQMLLIEVQNSSIAALNIKQPEEIIQKIFMEFSLQFGSAFDSKILKNGEGYQQALIKKWCSILSGIHPIMIELGLKKVEKSGRTFPPNPSEFLALCQLTAEDLGLPTVEESYHVIMSSLGIKQGSNQPLINHLKRIYKIPFHHLVSTKIDKFILQQQKNFQSGYEQIKKGHDQAVESIVKNQKFPEWPVAALEEAIEICKTCNKEKAKHYIDLINITIGNCKPHPTATN